MITNKRQSGPVRLDRDGVPIDPNDWTVDDWRTLWTGMQGTKAMIAKNHRETIAPIAGAENQDVTSVTPNATTATATGSGSWAWTGIASTG